MGILVYRNASPRACAWLLPLERGLLPTPHQLAVSCLGLLSHPPPPALAFVLFPATRNTRKHALSPTRTLRPIQQQHKATNTRRLQI